MMAFCSVTPANRHSPRGGRLAKAASNSEIVPVVRGPGLTLATSNSVEALCAKALAADKIETRATQATRIVLLQRGVSVFRGSFDVVNDQHVCANHGRLQLQPELFAKRCKDRRWIVWTRGGWWNTRVRELDGVEPGQPRAVDNLAIDRTLEQHAEIGERKRPCIHGVAH